MSRGGRRTTHGFTLLEVLVVLVIIGIVIGFAVLRIDTRSDELDREARRLIALLDLVRQEAILNGAEYAVQFSADDYRFLRLADDGSWQEVSGDPVLRPRRLPDFLTISLEIEGEEIKTMLADPESPPRLYVLSSGEMTAFTLYLEEQQGDLVYRIVGTPTGHLSLERS